MNRELESKFSCKCHKSSHSWELQEVAFCPVTRTVCENTPDKEGCRQRNPPLMTSSASVFTSKAWKRFRHCWDLSGGCLLTAHLENKSLDWGIWMRSYWLNWGILLYNPEAVTPGCTSPAGWSMEPQISALQSNKQANHKILLGQKLKA